MLRSIDIWYPAVLLPCATLTACQFFPHRTDKGRYARSHAWRQLNQALDQAPTFSAGNEVDALVHRQGRILAAPLIIFREAFEEPSDGNPKRPANLVDHGGTHSVPGILVFLELLNADTYRSSKLNLRNVQLNSNGRDLPADMYIDRVRIGPDVWICVQRARAFRFQRCFGSPWGRSDQEPVAG